MKNTKINGKWDIKLPIHRSERPEWPTWEHERLQSMYENIEAGDRLIYVGAEEGDMAALCAMWGAEVFVIEPNDKVWPNIKAIWQANKLETPHCFAGFAGAHTSPEIGEMKLSELKAWPVCADDVVIGDHGFKTLHEYPEIPRIAIDDLAWSPDAVSIDVEGAEMRVLEGMVETMKHNKPKIWLSGHPEFMFDIYKEYLSDVRGFVKSFGYTEQLLAYDHEVHLYYHVEY